MSLRCTGDIIAAIATTGIFFGITTTGHVFTSRCPEFVSISEPIATGIATAIGVIFTGIGVDTITKMV